jgi:hypothetical protein
LKALGGLFVQVLIVCKEAGLVKLGHVALDGTKVKANASKHKAMSYGRMCEAEKELQAQVDGLLKEAEDVDREEDRKYGRGKRGDELPEELRFRESRLKKIREAKAALEREARERARSEESEDGEERPTDGEGGQAAEKPKPTAQRNFTDPDSRIMKDSGTKSFVQGYNAQAAVDSHAQIIVAADVTDEPNDKSRVEPAMKQIEENLGQRPKELSADAGYYSEGNVTFLEENGVEAFIAPEKKRHRAKDLPAPRGRIPKDLSAKDRMLRKLRTKRGKERYGLRKELAEPVFGQIKWARGFRQFLLRGLRKVREEWRIISLTHNVLKLRRHAYAVAAG